MFMAFLAVQTTTSYLSLQNLLAGALFGLPVGFTLAVALTTVGSTFCYLLSLTCGQHYIHKFFRERVAFLRQKIDEQERGLIFVLLFLRLLPMTPNWFLNMACPVVGVPLKPFVLSVLIGELARSSDTMAIVFAPVLEPNYPLRTQTCATMLALTPERSLYHSAPAPAVFGAKKRNAS